MRRAVLSVASDHHLWPIRATVLASAGYAVTPATNLRDALLALDQYPYDAVVIGHSMPDFAVELLLEKMRRNGGVPVLFVSGARGEREVPVSMQVKGLEGPQALLDKLQQLTGGPRGEKKPPAAAAAAPAGSEAHSAD